MTLARKHKVIVEVTFNKPLTDHDAVMGVNRMLERVELDQKPVWDNALNIYVDKWRGKFLRKYLAWLKGQDDSVLTCGSLPTTTTPSPLNGNWPGGWWILPLFVTSAFGWYTIWNWVWEMLK